jgi:hypothetical protein
MILEIVFTLLSIYLKIYYPFSDFNIRLINYIRLEK